MNTNLFCFFLLFNESRLTHNFLNYFPIFLGKISYIFIFILCNTHRENFSFFLLAFFYFFTSAFWITKNIYRERIIFLFFIWQKFLLFYTNTQTHTQDIFSLSLSLYYFFQDIDPCCTYMYDNPSFSSMFYSSLLLTENSSFLFCLFFNLLIRPI